MHTSKAFPELLTSTVHEAFIDAGEELPLEYPWVFNVEDQTYNPEVYQQYSGLGQINEKPEGTPFPEDQIESGGQKLFEPTSYGGKVEAPEELLDDDQFGIMANLAKPLGRSMHHRMETNFWSVLNNAFDANFNGYEAGVALCSVSHTAIKSGEVQANKPVVDVPIGETALQEALTAYQTLNNESGQPQALRPSMLVVHPSEQFTVRQLLGSSGRPFALTNEINAIIEDDLRWMISHYLTSLTAWFLLAARGQHQMCAKIRKAPQITTWWDNDTLSALLAVHARIGEGFRSWRGVFGSTGI